jgi:checkpoint serine/threonine-protein kinase
MRPSHMVAWRTQNFSLQERAPASVRRLFVKAKAAHIGEDGSLLLMEKGESETLQDVINAYRKNGSSMDEHLVAFYTIELLRMCEALQQ